MKDKGYILLIIILVFCLIGLLVKFSIFNDNKNLNNNSKMEAGRIENNKNTEINKISEDAIPDIKTTSTIEKYVDNLIETAGEVIEKKDKYLVIKVIPGETEKIFFDSSVEIKKNYAKSEFSDMGLNDIALGDKVDIFLETISKKARKIIVNDSNITPSHE